ncbi:hypothetical protein LSH36_162g05033 [Paralvinella palmiformis]|uniref:DNA helicase MCM8 n=1 Tax=Paralvinella palmiformis TaxID=53620 RepID=A0AAD9JT53_9ANNE|nr:hypothetical protein LSH36_162g05033 [Paralvinella palmiformis]
MTRKLKDELEPDNTSLTSPSTQLTPEEACVPTLPKLNCRILNYGPVVPLRDLKANYYGKFVTIKGTVVRVSNIKPLCTKMTFICNSCNATQVGLLPDGKYIIPTKCASSKCRGRSFQPKRDDKLTETIDWQMIRLQEIMNDEQTESGRIPRTLDCEFTQDLVDSCIPGDMVTVSGIVKVHRSEEGNNRNRDRCMFLLYLHANSVTNAKAGSNLDRGGATQSLCPGIYGHEMVKAGLVLGLFGGSQKYINEQNRIPVRGDPHILIVGDPGLGKSQVTLCKEGGGQGDYVLEAGALVLADQGCCCIDEFDKMGNQHQALLEAMEQQSISIAKAGIVCRKLDLSLSSLMPRSEAESEELAHWQAEKPLSERLKLSRGDYLDPVSPVILRKKFYLELRKRHQTQDSTPITTRQLESLIRLTEWSIFLCSMIDTYSDECGLLDFSRSQHGSGMSKKGKVKKLVALLQRESEKTYNSLFTVQEIRQIAQDAKLNIPDFEEFISSLNHQGFLLKKGPRVYQLQTAGF